ncbi:ATP-binding cassette, subfamily B/ATP-binding cassette, subfamily B, MsbA [Tindallia magadiensis]|uniref:ATP-binding cassette, subfamily B/ATP-binding cassette, subfamily B, MsbA n=1 Tax=Tindallia magadiensis TaxID=69895 RepID=A0A1I3DSQ9_9FIRM|nr:ABC transporter ATP-binding protein [Tindallia magadiensis]SFH89588.1 ATP-binding cassette, subfamily B/ATP-binding cassette, subfamily B, MsbA [Tindallia magadiensis]
MKLLPFLKPYRWSLMIIFFLLMIISFLTTLPPWIMQYAIDEVLPSGDSNWLPLLALGILFVSLTEGILSFIQQVFSEYIGQKIIYSIRNQVFHHINQLSFSFYDKNRTGDLMSRIVSDADTLNRFISFGLLKVVTNTLILFWIFITLFYWNYLMGLLFLFLIPPMAHAMFTYANKVRPAFQKIRKHTGFLSSQAQENLAGIEVIKSFGNEAYQHNQFTEENEKLLNHTLAANKISAFWMPYAETLIGFFTGIVLLMGGLLASMDQISTGTLIAFLAYINMLRRPIRQTGFLLNLFSQSDAAASRILDLLNQKDSLTDVPNARNFKTLQHSIDLNHISFAYKDHLVLSNINLRINSGESIALIGPSGAGKTTLVHLLMRFYQPTKGNILIDNIPVSHYTLSSLRTKIGFVMQDPFLFNGSIEDNLRLGSPKATFQEVQQAAKEAQLDSFIQSLPSGYNSQIGERGVLLSGGQAQRLALARVLLKKPEILILDEPTSNIDSITDSAIMDTIAALMQDRTTITIAHRLSTIQKASRVFYLQKGFLIASGTHQELMKSSEDYKQFVSLNMKGSLSK